MSNNPFHNLPAFFSPTAKTVLVLATVLITVQTLESQAEAQRGFGNGRLLRRIFGGSETNTPKPAAKPSGSSTKTPTAATKPSQKSTPTAANRSNGATQNGLANPATGSTTRGSEKLPVAARRSDRETSVGFGMLVELRQNGLVVTQMDPRGNAKAAGIRVGDQLISGGGIEFETLEDLNGIGEILSGGDQLEFEYRRGSQKAKTLIAFGTAPQPEDEAPSEINEGSGTKETTTSPAAVDRVNRRANDSFLPNNNNVKRPAINSGKSVSLGQTTGRSTASGSISRQRQQLKQDSAQLRQYIRGGLVRRQPSQY